jgi:hypothetical protein
MYVKSIKMSFEVTFILFECMPYVWEVLVPLLNLDPNSEVEKIVYL